MVKSMRIILSIVLFSLNQTNIFSMSSLEGLPSAPDLSLPAPTIVAPTPDVSAPVMASPTPDQGAGAPAPTAPPTTPPSLAAATPEVQSQQFGPPDTIALTEEKIGLMAKNNPNLAILYNQAVTAVQQMAVAIKAMQAQRDTLVGKYNDLDKSMTDLWPINGVLQERFKGLSQGNAQEHATDLKQLSDFFHVILDKKNNALTLQSKFSQEIAQAQISMQDANVKKETIFAQGNDQEAQAIVTDISTTLQNVQNLQTTNQSQTAAPFQADLDQITQTVAALRTLINTLQHQGFALQIEQEQAAAAAKPPTPEKHEKSGFVSWLIPPPPKKGIPTGQAPTFVHYIFTRMADLITDGIKIMYDTGGYLKSKTQYVWKKYITKEPLPVPTIKPLPITQQVQVPTMPTTTPITPDKTPSMPVTTTPTMGT